MRIAYFDCFSGISGDMALGALIDVGVPIDELLTGLRTMPLSGWDLQVDGVRKGTIAATSVTVITDRENQTPRPELHHPKYHERHLSDIERLVIVSQLPESIKDQSISIFRLLAEAEAKVHGININKVHFHEVGAVDSIVDIVGTVYALHLLEVQQVYASAVPFSHGRVKTKHGELPVPAPATMELLCGLPTYPVDIDAELVTPTGAALLKGLAKSFGAPPPFTPQKVGYGAGKRDLPFPNVLRVIIGEMPDSLALERERLTVVETNLDDMTGEMAGFVMEQIFEAGAKDVWFAPVQMKKNRPAMLLSVLCDNTLLPTILQILFRETTTLGVRLQEVERLCLPREVWEVQTPYGTMHVKVAKLGEEIVNLAPEYEDCRRIAIEHSIPLKQVMAAALEAVRSKARSED